MRGRGDVRLVGMVHACMLGVNECPTLSWSYSHDGWSRDAAGVSERTAVPCDILLLPPSPGTRSSGTLTSCTFFFCIFGPLDSKKGTSSTFLKKLRFKLPAFMLTCSQKAIFAKTIVKLSLSCSKYLYYLVLWFV